MDMLPWKWDRSGKLRLRPRSECKLQQRKNMKGAHHGAVASHHLLKAALARQVRTVDTKFLKGQGQHLTRINNEASGGCMSDMLEDFVGLRVPAAGERACFSNGYPQHAMKDPKVPRTSHRHVALICAPICPGLGRIFNLRVAERHNS